MWKDAREKRDMAMEQIQWFPSIIVACLVPMALSATGFPPLSGILMCKEKCLNTKGCDRLAYSFQTFTCYLQGDVIPSFETDLHKMNISQDDLIRTGSSCRPGDRIIRSRQGIIRCVSDVKSNIKTTRDQGKASRLLFKEIVGMSSIKQVDLRRDELSIQPYWNINQSPIIFLLYNRFTNFVYVGYLMNLEKSNHQFEVSVSKLDSIRNERLIRVNSLRFIGLDEKRDWILMSERGFTGVFKIVGVNRTRMFKTSRLNPNSFAICSESQIIYLLTRTNIYTFTYSGKRRCILSLKQAIELCLDRQGKHLYFFSLAEKVIFRYNTVTTKVDTFVSLQYFPFVTNIAVDSESLYVKTGSVIVFYSLSKRRVTREIRGISDRQIRLCLVF